MCQVGEIYWANFPHEEDPKNCDRRPSIIVAINDNYCECVALKITTKQGSSNPNQYAIEHWHVAGLNNPSYICIDRKHRFFYDELLDQIGVLHPEDELNLLHKLGEYYENESSLF